MTNDIRLPPQNLAAEKSVLSCQMLMPERIDLVRDIIGVNDFWKPEHQTIQKAIFKLHESGGVVDPVTLGAQLESEGEFEAIGGAPYLLEVMEDMPHGAHAVHYAELVAACSRRRQAIQLGNDLVAKAYRMDTDEKALMSTAMESAMKLMDLLTKVEKIAPKELKDHVAALLEGARQGDQPTHFVGIPEIDRAIGGAAFGQQIVIGARPAVGKSSMALQWLDCAASHGWPGLFVSEEMPPNLIAERSVSYLTDIDRDSWGYQIDRVEFDAREHFRGRAPIIIAENCGTIGAIERTIARTVKTHGIKIVAVDYIQLVSGDGEGQEQEIADVARRLKQAATRHNVVVIALSQLSRPMKGREADPPKMSDLRGSGQVEANADVILMPFWPASVDEDYKDKTEYRIYQVKNRRGIGEAIIQMRYRKERQRLEPYGGAWEGPETDDWMNR